MDLNRNQKKRDQCPWDLRRPWHLQLKLFIRLPHHWKKSNQEQKNLCKPRPSLPHLGIKFFRSSRKSQLFGNGSYLWQWFERDKNWLSLRLWRSPLLPESLWALRLCQNIHEGHRLLGETGHGRRTKSHFLRQKGISQRGSHLVLQDARDCSCQRQVW